MGFTVEAHQRFALGVLERLAARKPTEGLRKVDVMTSRERRRGRRFAGPRPGVGGRTALAGQLNLERRGGRTLDGVAARIAQRILALTAVIWHNDHTGQPVMRSLIAYDH